MAIFTKTNLRSRRHARVRAKLRGTNVRPRLAIFRSNRFTYAQLIDDVAGRTLAAADTRELPSRGKTAAKSAGKRASDVGFTKVPEAFALGKLLAERAVAKKIDRVCFDRGGYLYTGRVRALAEGAREGGLIF